jgi:UDP-N-acetylmuramate dehydrogenase
MYKSPADGDTRNRFNHGKRQPNVLQCVTYRQKNRELESFFENHDTVSNPKNWARQIAFKGILCLNRMAMTGMLEKADFDPAELALQLARVGDGDVRMHERLAGWTSYKIGGPTAIWVAPSSAEAIGPILAIVQASTAPLFVLGRGSNVLVSDRGWNGVTLYLGENLSGWRFEQTDALVLAGTLLTDVIQAAVKQGLSGMELMAGIPGSVGGALRMNAGAFGQEIEGVTAEISGFQRDGSPFRALRPQIDFSYRRAAALEDVVIATARLRFKAADPALLTARMQETLTLRAKKQPLKFPSCGSVFKRPPGYFAGALIEAAGLKGERIGGAMVSRRHAGFILNVADASAADVYALIRCIEERVMDRFGVQLEREVKLIGEFDEPS